jgi:hypothetical protein
MKGDVVPYKEAAVDDEGDVDEAVAIDVAEGDRNDVEG